MNIRRSLNKKLNRNDLLVKWYSRILKISVLYLFIFLLYRMILFSSFSDVSLSSYGTSNLLSTFFYGSIYDLKAIAYMMLPLFVLSFISYLGKYSFLTNLMNFIGKLYVSFLGIVLPIILSLDLVFYFFYKDHFNSLIFEVINSKSYYESFEKFQSHRYFEVLIIISVVLIFLNLFSSFKVFGSFTKGRTFTKSGPSRFFILTSISTFLFIGALRGGYSREVLSVENFSPTSNPFLNTTASNGLLSLNSLVLDQLEKSETHKNIAREMGYKGSIKEAFSDYLGFDVSLTKQKELFTLLERKTSSNLLLEKMKPHVVVVVSQDFHSYGIKSNSDTFPILGGLDKHFKEDYYFENFINSQASSFETLLGIVTNIPYLPYLNLLSESKFMNTSLPSAAQQVFRKNGYETVFLYGGALGEHGIGKYMTVQNFHKVMGYKAILEKSQRTNSFFSRSRVSDEELFSFLLTFLENSKRPQFIVVMSNGHKPSVEKVEGYTSSDFQLPDKFSPKEDVEKVKKKFELLEYSNKTLSSFLDKLKASEISQKTVLSITGAVGEKDFFSFKPTEIFKKHLVPFYLYLPNDLRLKEVNLLKVGSHEDIMTTLYNVSLSDTSYFSFGENLLTQSQGYAINYEVYASSKGLVFEDQDYEWSEIPLNKSTAKPLYLKSLRRQYRSTLSIVDFYLKNMYLKAKQEKSN